MVKKKGNRSTDFIKIIIVSLGIIVTSLFLFKKIRAFFPVPEIGSDGLVGFSHYFGYPLYFDTVFFFFLILIPLIVTFLFKRLGNGNY